MERCSVIRVIAVVLQSTISPFWFSLTVRIPPFVSAEALINPLCRSCPAPESKVTE